GRPFDAASRVLGGLPSPQPLAGALRTALLARHGFDFAAFGRRRRGGPGGWARGPRGGGGPGWGGGGRARAPRRRPGGGGGGGGGGAVGPLLPVPATLGRQGGLGAGEWHRAQPLRAGELPGWSHPDGLLPLWRRGAPDAKHPGGFLTPGGTARFLEGG